MAKEWDAAERSIANPAAFLAWGIADIGVKKKAFRSQSKALDEEAQSKLEIEKFFDPEEIRKLYSGLHGDVKKASEGTQQQWEVNKTGVVGASKKNAIY